MGDNMTTPRIDKIKKPCKSPQCKYYKIDRGDPTGFLRMIPPQLCLSCKDMEQKGYRYCPNCKNWYVPRHVNHATAMLQRNKHDKEGREQWISGMCSDKCWDEFLGVV